MGRGWQAELDYPHYREGVVQPHQEREQTMARQTFRGDVAQELKDVFLRQSAWNDENFSLYRALVAWAVERFDVPADVD